ncbi:hypothetical protein C495_01010 [Natronorubrum sulfidifaciens JCM 14089]|uniref:DUF8161 domain-containing protein n=2 Tax=Natronorubrum sulfidifaciens TaxID=388259 RepID=L9WIB5_9EURY|nr:hypothetical protein [Natronorubrum sulfidifaciens]ELY49189.1 hypothetical protein C495_01010 [Natronorubrum sulfidifaciens JCM 14089]
MVDDVDPENPRPEGHYPRFKNNEWHYVPDELAQTISLGPAGDGEEGEQVDLDRAVPNPRGEPCHKYCWAEYTGAPEWFSGHV